LNATKESLFQMLITNSKALIKIVAIYFERFLN